MENLARFTEGLSLRVPNVWWSRLAYCLPAGMGPRKQPRRVIGELAGWWTREPGTTTSPRRAARHRAATPPASPPPLPPRPPPFIRFGKSSEFLTATPGTPTCVSSPCAGGPAGELVCAPSVPQPTQQPQPQLEPGTAATQAAAPGFISGGSEIHPEYLRRPRRDSARGLAVRPSAAAARAWRPSWRRGRPRPAGRP